MGFASLILPLLDLPNFLPAALFGATLVWVGRTLHTRGGVDKNGQLPGIIELAGLVLLAGTILATLLVVFGWTLVVLAGLVIVMVIIVIGRYRESENRVLCATLRIAAQRGIPLAKAAGALAEEQSMVANPRIRRLTALLESGVTLDEALAQSRLKLPVATLLAARIGCLTGDLGMVLRQAEDRTVTDDALRANLLEKLFYAVFVLAAIFQFVFLWRSGMFPGFRGMLAESNDEVPRVAQNFTDLTELLAANSLPALLVMGLLGLVLLACFHGYVHGTRTDLPLIRRLWLPVDRSIVLHTLATAVRHQHSVAATLRMMQSQYPTKGIRARLGNVVAAIDAGAHWCDSLRAAGFVNARDSALVRAAEQVGNVAWALDELADRKLRRVQRRFKMLLDTAFPLFVLAVGLLVLAAAMAEVACLAELIKGNAW